MDTADLEYPHILYILLLNPHTLITSKMYGINWRRAHRGPINQRSISKKVYKRNEFIFLLHFSRIWYITCQGDYGIFLRAEGILQNIKYSFVCCVFFLISDSFCEIIFQFVKYIECFSFNTSVQNDSFFIICTYSTHIQPILLPECSIYFSIAKK